MEHDFDIWLGIRKLENRSNENTSVGRLYTRRTTRRTRTRKKEICDNGDASLA
jgi:hypothetical protein